MKKLLTLLFFCISISAFAQSPDAFNYQAVVRDGSGNILANQNVGFRIAILQGSQTGSIVYQESHALATNNFGLANMSVGTGSVLNGNFSTIDWSNGPYFVQTAIDPTGGNTYAVMGTAQLISVPYALHAGNVPSNVSELTNDAGYVTSADDADNNPINEIQSLSINGSMLSISDGNTITLPTGGSGGNTLDMAYDQGGAGIGRSITVDADEVEMTTASANGNALKLVNTNTGTALVAETTNPATAFSAIQAETNSSSTAAAAIVGSSSGAAWAVTGQAEANSTTEAAIYGSNLRTNGGHGVRGVGFNGVVGETGQSTGNAMYGENFDQIAPLGNGIGVAGTGYYGVVGEDRYLGGVAGAFGVYSNGELGASGLKTFHIDHPADPENKFLRHFSSESNEVLNIYRGNVVFNADGEAIVEMPVYYDLINKNPSYQLTPIGGYMQLFIKEKMESGQFVIGGGTEGAEASWTVYAERNDPYLQQYPEKRAVEIEKREGQKGKYLMPQLYGESMDTKMIPTSGKTEVEQPKVNVKK